MLPDITPKSTGGKTPSYLSRDTKKNLEFDDMKRQFSFRKNSMALDKNLLEKNNHEAKVAQKEQQFKTLKNYYKNYDYSAPG